MSYYNGSSYTFTWEGRRLVGAVKGSNTMSFEYNDEGIRTSKTVNAVKTVYYVNGGQIVAEKTGTRTIVYIYDASGTPIGMMYRTTSYAEGAFDVFWYEKNLQGDIVAVYNSSGTKLVTYDYYDAWGNYTVSYSNNGATTGAQYNPFRYRGYYYDTDLGMYYLQSRYYDAKICRFISADGYVSTGQGILGNNMFAYCNNNSVAFCDPSGHDAIYVVFYEGSGGLPIVGHAGLFYQDADGCWWFTHYAGKTMLDAKISTYRIRYSSDSILLELENGDCSYKYLEGDYSSAGEYVENHEGTNYGGYSFLTNNCLHYIHAVLNYAKYENNIQMYEEQNTIVPSLYFSEHIDDVITRLFIKWKQWIEKVSKPIYI